MSAPDPVSVLSAYAVDGLLTTEDDPEFWAAVLQYHWPMVEVSRFPAVKDASSALVLQGYDWSPSNSEADPYEDNPYITPEDNAEFRRRHEETVERWKHLPPWAYETVRAASPYAVWLPRGQFSRMPISEQVIAEFSESFDAAKIMKDWCDAMARFGRRVPSREELRAQLRICASVHSGWFQFSIAGEPTHGAPDPGRSRRPSEGERCNLSFLPAGGLGRLTLIEGRSLLPINPTQYSLTVPRPSRGVAEVEVHTSEYSGPLAASAYVTRWCRQPDGSWAAAETNWTMIS